MLPLLRPRCSLLSIPLAQTRALRTTPRQVPFYIKRWDPTLQTSIVPQQWSIEPRQPAQTSQEPAAFGRHCTHRKTRRFQSRLSIAETQDAFFDTTLPAALRKDYIAAKNVDPSLVWRLSRHAWNVLWNTQVQEWPISRRGVAHLSQLSRTMLTVGTPVTSRQWAQYAEIMFLSGEEEKALSVWEERYKMPYDVAHLQVGAKLHALVGNVDRAHEILDKLFEFGPDWDMSVVMTVFRAHTSSDLSAHHDVAKQLYVKMKERKGKAISIVDYDAWLVGFLESRSLQHAMQVFKDMVKDGHLTTAGTKGDISGALQRLHMVYRLGTDIQKMTSIVLDALSFLPQTYHEHLCSQWINSANAAGEPLAAAQVLEIMFKRGYAPEPHHFNSLIRVLLRTKEKASVLKAESIGWNMIEQAEQIRPRRRKQGWTANIFVEQEFQTPVPLNSDTVRQFPPANTSTFALMMQHHAKALQWEHVDYLTRKLEEADLPPNSTIMNVLIDNKCRQGAYASAWETYTSLTSPENSREGLFPDGATFRMLWKILRLSLGDYATREDPRMPSPRELLKEMVDWSMLIHSRYDAEQFRQGLAGSSRGAIMKLVMHCFSYAQDLPGSLVALHVLYDRFGVRPTSQAAEILQRQITWVDLSGESRAERSQFFHGRTNRLQVHRVARIYDVLMRRRIDKMMVAGIDLEMSTLVERQEIGLNLLSEFVRTIMKKAHPPEDVEAMIQEVKEFIGLPQLPTGDLTAFEVA